MKHVIGPTIKIYSGEYFNFTNPRSSMFTIEDIAHALSNICRFTGHCKEFYSVAQHSVLVSHVVPLEHAMDGLLHDGAEAFIGDVSSPLKRLLPDYQMIEHSVEQAIRQRFGLAVDLPNSVKQADLILLRTEQRDLINADGEIWPITQELTPLEDVIVPLSPKEAYRLFMERYEDLLLD